MTSGMFSRERAARQCGDQEVSVFHYYSLGGDTTALGGLYAGLCHAFLVLNKSVINMFKNIYSIKETQTCDHKSTAKLTLIG